jgi:hypothetical protein
MGKQLVNFITCSWNTINQIKSNQKPIKELLQYLMLQQHCDMYIYICISKKYMIYMMLALQVKVEHTLQWGGSRSTQREPPTMGKQLVNFITCSCESSAPFL